MRIIKEAFLKDGAKAFPKTRTYLETWRMVVRAATWRGLADVRRTYPKTDAVKVASGRQVLVFNVCGNDYRLIVAAHYNRQTVYMLRLLTHTEYDKDKWKAEL